jgi:hypothetical protein
MQLLTTDRTIPEALDSEQMITYWLLFLFPAFAALAIRDRGPSGPEARLRLTPGWFVFGLLLTIIIGFRYQVGGDWYNYLGHLDEARGQPFAELITQSDPGYKLLNGLSLAAGWDIYGVNTAAALVFSIGLISFCRRLPRPWLGAAVAVPYLAIVVAMGYSRQGMALGFAMLGLMALERRSVRKFAFWILVATAFHRSALLLLPIAALTETKNRIWIAFWIAILAAVGYMAFLEQDVSVLYTNYIERGYESQGALIRLGMNAFAAGLLLTFQRRFQILPESLALWRWISLLSLFLFLAYFVSPGSSTALDRLGLYLLPLQLFVFSHLPSILGRRKAKPWVAVIIGYCIAVQFVWLNYAGNNFAWLPYRNITFE